MMCGPADDPTQYDRPLPAPPRHIVVSGDDAAAIASIRPATDADGRYLDEVRPFPKVASSGETWAEFQARTRAGWYGEMASTAGDDGPDEPVVVRRPSLLRRLAAAFRWGW